MITRRSLFAVVAGAPLGVPAMAKKIAGPMIWPAQAYPTQHFVPHVAGVAAEQLQVILQKHTREFVRYLREYDKRHG